MFDSEEQSRLMQCLVPVGNFIYLYVAASLLSVLRFPDHMVSGIVHMIEALLELHATAAKLIATGENSICIKN